MVTAAANRSRSTVLGSGATPSGVPLNGADYHHTYYHPGQGWIWADTAPPALLDESMEFIFDPTAGTIDTLMPQGGRVDLSAWKSFTIQNAAKAATAAALLCHRGLHHPHQYGFVLQLNGKTALRTNLPSVQVGRRAYSVTFPEQEKRGDVGWFPPGVDPTEFGALYLAPSTTLTPQLSTVWGLHQVGIPRPVYQAQWNDAGGCARLRSVAEDPAMRDVWLAKSAAYEDPDRFRRMKRFVVSRQEALGALHVFSRPKDRVKPRLVGDAAEEAASRMGSGWKETLRNAGLIPTPDAHPLRVSHNSLVPAERGAQCNIGVSVNFPDRGSTPHLTLPDDYFDGWAARFTDLLSQRSLGSLFRYLRPRPDSRRSVPLGSGGYAYLVIKSPDLAFRYPDILKIPAGVSVERFSPEGRPQNQVWVPHHTFSSD